MNPGRVRADAVVVGSGPNGLAAAIRLADAGLSVTVLERSEHAGGGVHSAGLTLPGYEHDVCSAAYPLGLGSPYLRTLGLERFGLEWVQPDAPLAHPLPEGRAVLLERSLDATAAALGGEDGAAYRKLMQPLVEGFEELAVDLLAPLRVPRHPILTGRFGLRALRSARGLARARFRGEAGRALFAGNAAHSMLSLDELPSAAFGLVLMAAGHVFGWPFVRGGARHLASALVARLEAAGGAVRTAHEVRSLDELDARLILLDLTPRQVLRVAGERLPASYRARLRRFRYGPAVFKLDWALSGPIPWSASQCRRAGTVHVGGTLAEIAASERAAAESRHTDLPFVLLTQPSLFDDTRAPAGHHTAWAYCHVPLGSERDMTMAIESQIERYAPGFRDIVLERSALSPTALEAMNPNFVGGHINGGLQDLRQLFFRPVVSLDPYATPVEGLFICSSSTPPGGGVHGMCGYHAAGSALASLG